MEYIQIKDINDPLFAKMHQLLGEVFPPEEVLEYDLWEEPIKDPTIRICVAVHNGEVVGATEYRYNIELNVAMTDFTIIGREGLGIGRFLTKNREADLMNLAANQGKKIKGMFAEIYDPYKATSHDFGRTKVMDPFVRREVLSHLGYRRLDFKYVHPSWVNDGRAVENLDFCFLPFDEGIIGLEGKFIAQFLKSYYQVLSNKPQEWIDMIKDLEDQELIKLREL